MSILSSSRESLSDLSNRIEHCIDLSSMPIRPSIMSSPLPWKLSSLPPEMLSHITAYLSLAEIHHLLLAGLGSLHVPTLNELRNEFLTRKRGLKCILHSMYPFFNCKNQLRALLRPISNNASRENSVHSSYTYVHPMNNKSLALHGFNRSPNPFPDWPNTPTILSLHRKELKLCNPSSEVATAIAREMPMLRCLRIAYVPTPRQLVRNTLPLAFGLCHQLRALSIRGCKLGQDFEAVMKLRNLQVLELFEIQDLLQFPEEIVYRVPKLAYVIIRNSASFEAIPPPSLLTTLERNFSINPEPPLARFGIFDNYARFQNGFWEDIDFKNLCPQLSNHVHGGYGAMFPRYNGSSEYEKIYDLKELR